MATSLEAVHGSPGTSEVQGIAKLDKRTKNLVKRLRPGDIAIIDHTDIDRVSAESLIEAKPALVVNAACSITGKYPNLGPLIIVASNIGIVDEVGAQIFDKVREGSSIRVVRGTIHFDEAEIARGTVLTLAQIEKRIEKSKQQLGRHLGDFAANTMEFLEQEQEILLESIDLPNIKTRFSGHHSLIVVRGQDYKRDLRVLRPYIREMKPVLVAVDGGADALIEMGYKPHLIIGDMDSVTDEALAKAPELVVHGYPDGRVPGEERLTDLGLPFVVFHYPGTSEDIAMLLAYEKGSEMISVVGGHTSLIDFLDKDRKGMASTFLVRLRIGAALVDAKGISQIYQQRVRAWHLILMVLAALITITIIIILSEPVRQFFTILALRLQVWLMRLQNLI